MNNLIANLLSSIKNSNVNHVAFAKAICSKGSLQLCNLLYNEGYIMGYKRQGKYIIIKLKYVGGVPSIKGLKIHSTPGRKLYTKQGFITKARTLNSYTIISSTKGFLNLKAAYLHHLGGELVLTIS